jgi:hypothetical protein
MEINFLNIFIIPCSSRIMLDSTKQTREREVVRHILTWFSPPRELDGGAQVDGEAASGAFSITPMRCSVVGKEAKGRQIPWRWRCSSGGWEEGRSVGFARWWGCGPTPRACTEEARPLSSRQVARATECALSQIRFHSKVVVFDEIYYLVVQTFLFKTIYPRKNHVNFLTIKIQIFQTTSDEQMTKNKKCRFWKVMQLCSWRLFHLKSSIKKKHVNFLTFEIQIFQTTSGGEMTKTKCCRSRKVINLYSWQLFHLNVFWSQTFILK